MILYWPMAKIKTESNDELFNTLFTSDGCLSMSEARSVIRSWAEQNQIIGAWIDKFNDGAKKARYILF